MIDIFLFEHQFQNFKEHVVKKSDMDLISFSLNRYTNEQEGYKRDLYCDARRLLRFETWNEADIGSGKIARSVLEAIEMPNNNLVQWQSRYGDEKRPHNALYTALDSSVKH